MIVDFNYVFNGYCGTNSLGGLNKNAVDYNFIENCFKITQIHLEIRIVENSTIDVLKMSHFITYI